MRCKHCQADSGQHPLCLTCWKKEQDKKREKPPSGGASKKVSIPTKLLKYWADKLYAISSSGIEYAETDFDEYRFEKVREISRSLYIAHKKAKGDTGYLSEAQLEFFKLRLDEIGKEGKQYSRNRYDEYRYGEIRLVQHEMVDLTAEPAPPPKPIAKAKEVGEFVSDDAIKPLLIALIDKANHKLDIASPWITVSDITERLKKAQARNVQVKVLARQIDENKTDIFYDLIANDIDVTTDNDLHAKMLIVDQQEMFLGSANLSGRSLTTNLEVGIHTTDTPIVKAASAYFKDKFQHAKMQSVTKIPRAKRR